jgi:hypothetical protein
VAIETNDPYKPMKDALVRDVQRRQAEHVDRQLNNQRNHDQAASDKASTARNDINERRMAPPTPRDREYYNGH